MYSENLAQEGVKALMLESIHGGYFVKRVGNMRAVSWFVPERTMVFVNFDMAIGKDRHFVGYDLPEIIGKPLEKYIDERSEDAKKILEESW